jgi:hypothetical protein
MADLERLVERIEEYRKLQHPAGTHTQVCALIASGGHRLSTDPTRASNTLSYCIIEAVLNGNFVSIDEAAGGIE